MNPDRDKNATQPQPPQLPSNIIYGDDTESLRSAQRQDSPSPSSNYDQISVPSPRGSDKASRASGSGADFSNRHDNDFILKSSVARGTGTSRRRWPHFVRGKQEGKERQTACIQGPTGGAREHGAIDCCAARSITVKKMHNGSSGDEDCGDEIMLSAGEGASELDAQSVRFHAVKQGFVYSNMELWAAKMPFETLSQKRLPKGAVATLDVDASVSLAMPLQHNSKGAVVGKISDGVHVGRWVVVCKPNGVELMQRADEQ